MRAAVVSSFDRAPSFEEFPTPAPSGPHEVLVDVVAAGLHPRVLSQANGSHYTSTDELPLIPGIDGVGRTEDGALRYFVLPDTAIGSMAEKTVVDLRRSIELPDGTDPVAVAAAMNPAMSSWIALRRRIAFEEGQRVLVLGATGNAGRIAVQVAKHLGASHVAAAGRNLDRAADVLSGLGADTLVELGGDPRQARSGLAEAGKDVDVVIDYLWGQPTSDALYAIVPARVDDDQQLSWVQVGSVAGPESPIPSAALRATRLQLVGSGQGSVSPRSIVEELPSLVAEVSAGTFDIGARAVALADVEQAWAEARKGSERLVVVP
ncbi:MAG: zinc-binding alcohol dehydrogenase family protein [Brevundimonas sp.]